MFLVLDSKARIFDSLEAALRAMREDGKAGREPSRCFEMREVFCSGDFDMESIKRLEIPRKVSKR
jgi:hypothetical protein